MNKFIALVLILGCASAVDWNKTNWATTPEVVVGANDTNFTGKTLSLFYGTDVLVLLAQGANETAYERNITVKGLTSTNKTDSTLSTSDVTGVNVVAANNVRLFAKVESNNGAQQINLYKGQYTGASVQVPLTKNTDNKLVLSILQVFAHRNRYFVVYSTGTGNITIASVGASDTTPQTVTLTTNATNATLKASCVGLSGKDNLYCLWLAKGQNVTVNTTDNKTITTTFNYLAEAIVDPLSTKDIVPFGSDYFQGSNYDISLISLIKAYNAGKQFGGLVNVNGTYSTKNGNTNKTVNVNVIGTPANYNAPTFVSTFEHLEQLAILWQFAETATPTNLVSGVQFVEKDGSTSSSDLLFANVTQVQFVQYSDGSLYSVGANTTDAYVGQVWGSTGLSASLLQTAFAAIFAIASAIVLI